MPLLFKKIAANRHSFQFSFASGFLIASGGDYPELPSKVKTKYFGE